MGQKVHPIGIRLGITKDWDSKWYADSREFPALVHSDFKIRQFLKEKLKDASVSRIQIERPAKRVQITIQDRKSVV
jgi:small subunit ribosomal protein S3